jgi:hypothetical protein
VTSRRRVLFVLQYPDYLRLFGDAVCALRARGVDVVLAFDKPGKNPESMTRALALAHVERTAWEPGEWQVLLEDLGCVVDYMRFMTPAFAGKQYLRRRMEKYLPERFSRLQQIRRLPGAVAKLAHRGARFLESLTPEDDAQTELLRRVQPDALIVSPVILRGRGSARQTQLVKTARRLGIPAAIAVGSWDHLSSKGLLRVRPDRLLVWNGVQRDEAIRYHGVDPATVTVTGAYPWQCWFEMQPTIDAGTFVAAAGLPPGVPYVLYVGSSRGIATPDAELAFVQRWLRSLRSSAVPALQRIAVLIRPHPGNWEHWEDARLDGLGPVAVWPRGARAVFMRQGDVAAYYHSIRYSEAVVGINTSAMIEATIIGRPVLSIRQPGVAQAETVHFEYLTPAAGGSTVVADSFEEHVSQLAAILRDPSRLDESRAAFVRAFIRPVELRGLPLDCFADAVEELMGERRRPQPTPVWLEPVRAAVRRLAILLAAGERPHQRAKPVQ